MAKNQASKVDWIGILEVLAFVIAAAVEVVKKWQDKEYVEEIKSDTKGKEAESASENK